MDFEYDKYLNYASNLIRYKGFYDINPMDSVHDFYLLWINDKKLFIENKKDFMKLILNAQRQKIYTKQIFDSNKKGQSIWQLDMQCKKCEEFLPLMCFYSWKDKYTLERTYQTCKKCLFAPKYTEGDIVSNHTKYFQKATEDVTDLYCKHILRLRGVKNPTIKQIEAQRQSIISLRNKKEIPILQFDLQGNLIKEFLSRKDVIDAGFCKIKISLVLNGKNKSHKGFIFKLKTTN